MYHLPLLHSIKHHSCILYEFTLLVTSIMSDWPHSAVSNHYIETGH